MLFYILLLTYCTMENLNEIWASKFETNFSDNALHVF